jgi:predicted aspartyl protease
MSKGTSRPIRIPGNIIALYSQISGPKDTKTLKMILDTGASYTMIPTRKAIEIGYNPTASERMI